MKKAEIYSKKYLSKEVLEIERSGRALEMPELTVYEKAVIYKYSNDGYEGLNEELRKKSGKIVKEFGKILIMSLSKLPDFEGLVYRGVFLTKLELNGYEEALKSYKPLTEYTFVSTSKSRLLAMQFGNTLFRIYSRTGKEIEKIAKFGIHNPPNEQEVLFKPNRQFRVLEVRKNETYTLISMEEI